MPRPYIVLLFATFGLCVSLAIHVTQVNYKPLCSTLSFSYPDDSLYI